MDKVQVVLPTHYDLVVGDTFQLFYRGIIEAVSPYCYDIVAVCEIGRNYPRYFELTPEDFIEYCRKMEVKSIDAVYIMLSWNGQSAERSSLVEFCQTMVEKGKSFVDILHIQYPMAKVKIMGLQMPSMNGGTGASYGAKLPYCDDYDLTRFVLELNRAYEAWTEEEAYCGFMEFINISGQFDSENNMPYAEKNVNTRSKVTERIGTNGLHPLTEGYLQIGDAVYRNMVKSFCQ